MARVPCVIGGTRLVVAVTSLIHSRGVRNVSGIGSRASHRNVHVIVSLGGSTGTDIILGGLCGVATLRSSFDMGGVTLMGNHPRLLGLGSLVHYFIRRHRRIVIHEAGCSLVGDRRHTRLLHKYVVVRSGLSRTVTVVHDSGGTRRTGDHLVRHFRLASHRTTCVIRVHLHRLAGVRRSGLHGRCRRLVGLVSSLGSVLTHIRHEVRVVGSRTARVGRGCNSNHHARVVCTDRRFGPRSFCTSSRVVVAVSRLNCVGHAPLTRFGTRGHNNMNSGNNSSHSRSFVRFVCPTSVRTAVVFFARGKHYC